MGLEKEFNSENNGAFDLSPNTVLPYRNCSRTERVCTNQKPPRKDDRLRIKEGFTEIKFRRCHSASSKNLPPRSSGLESGVEGKRSSVYQSSKEARKVRTMSTIKENEKFQMSRSSDTSLSFRIIDPLLSLDESHHRKRSNSTHLIKAKGERCSTKVCIESDTMSDRREKVCDDLAERDLLEDLRFSCEQVVSPPNDGNEMLPSLSESDSSYKDSSKTRFTPMKKIFDPFMKSKSLRSPLGYGETKTLGMESLRRSTGFRKSLFNEFSYTARNSKGEAPSVSDDHRCSVVKLSPVHLHGSLKLINKTGEPSFEFSLNCPEEVFVAKSQKSGNAWVYTFQSVCSRKRSNVGGRVSYDNNKEFSDVGKMQVFCHLYSELKHGNSSDSMVTEFVLYDMAHAKETHGISGCCDYNDVLDSSNRCPFLETAAIVIQVPFEKRESLKYKRGHMKTDKVNVNLLSVSKGEHVKEIHETKAFEDVKVVIPSGNHGMPSDERNRPSTLLERWRLGGGCDCGGWDMGCPIVILGNPGIQHDDNRAVLDSHQPLELCFQGSKESTPALSMKVVEEGSYEVDFHAQLSTLQAFSICVALLHGTETPVSPGLDKKQNMPAAACNNILKVLIEEEVKLLVEAVSSEGKKKTQKRVQDIPQSYTINPPFSPIARV